MDGIFLLNNGSLSIHVPPVDVPGDSASTPSTNPVPYSSGSATTRHTPRTAVFYDENLTYYIQLEINEDHLPSFLLPSAFTAPEAAAATEPKPGAASGTDSAAPISPDDFKRFISALKLVVDVKISGTVTVMLPDAPSDRPRSHPPRQVSQLQAYELFTSALDTTELVYYGKSSAQDTSDSARLWVAVWKVSTVISHPRARLFKPQVIIGVTASYSENALHSADEDPSSASASTTHKLSHQISMINLGTNTSGSKGPTSLADRKRHSITSTANSRKNSLVNGTGNGLEQEISVKFLDEFEPVEDTNLFGPLHSDQVIKPIRSRLAVNRLIATAPRLAKINGSTPEISGPSSPGRNSPQTKQQPLNKTAQSNSLSVPSEGQFPLQISESSTALPISTISSTTSFPVFPAVNLRLRCTKATGMQDSIVSILEIDNSENALFNVVIKSAVLDFTAGSAIEFGSASFPLWLSPGESCSIAYHLSHPDAGLPQTRVKPITIVLSTIPVLNSANQQQSTQLENIEGLDFKDVGPEIITKWETIVDFGVVAPVTPGASKMTAPVSFASASGGVKKLLRSQETNIKTQQSQQQLQQSNGTIVTAPARTAGAATVSTLSQLSGLVLSFSAPSAVKVGEVFSWKVFAINKSFTNRHLTLYIQPKEREEKLRRNDRFASSYTPILDPVKLRRLREDRALSGLSGIGIVSLMNDVRIGPLGAQACYETEIKMLALAPGQFTLEGLTVVDLTTGDSYECGRLLDVIVSD